MREQKVHIDWQYEGATDYSAGTGAYPTERMLAMLAALVVPGFVIYLIVSGQVDWNVLQVIVVMLMAIDISGGLVANALNSCKRFYHTPPKPSEGRLGVILKHPVVFSLLHVHPIVAGLLLDEWNWLYGVSWYGFFLVAVGMVLFAPLYLRRPLAMLWIMIAVLVNFYVIVPVEGLEWLMPLLFIKIIYGHLVREEPYRKLPS